MPATVGSLTSVVSTAASRMISAGRFCRSWKPCVARRWHAAEGHQGRHLGRAQAQRRRRLPWCIIWQTQHAEVKGVKLEQGIGARNQSSSAQLGGWAKAGSPEAVHTFPALATQSLTMKLDGLETLSLRSHFVVGASETRSASNLTPSDAALRIGACGVERRFDGRDQLPHRARRGIREPHFGVECLLDDVDHDRATESAFLRQLGRWTAAFKRTNPETSCLAPANDAPLD